MQGQCGLMVPQGPCSMQLVTTSKRVGCASLLGNSADTIRSYSSGLRGLWSECKMSRMCAWGRPLFCHSMTWMLAHIESPGSIKRCKRWVRTSRSGKRSSKLVMSSNRPEAQAYPRIISPLHSLIICRNLQPLASYQVDNETWFACCNQIISAM
jgi:hypothetical protein